MFQISLIASFIAGMVALFAPCCISYLFPAYVGNIFREKSRVLFMTLIYSLGIFVVMFPVVLGAKVLSMLFFRLHDYTYIFGGLFMIAVSFFSLLGIKMPMPRFTRVQKNSNQTDIASTFTLGVFSGITSACCAPVLIGVVALSSLSPTLVQSLLVGAFYVFGMVTPLYIAALLIDKRNILARPIFKKTLFTISLFGESYPIFVSNAVAFVTFLLAGVFMLFMTITGNMAMEMGERSVIKTINQISLSITDITGRIHGINVLFGVIGVYLLYRLVKEAVGYKKKDDCCNDLKKTSRKSDTIVE